MGRPRAPARKRRSDVRLMDKTNGSRVAHPTPAAEAILFENRHPTPLAIGKAEKQQRLAGRCLGTLRVLRTAVPLNPEKNTAPMLRQTARKDNNFRAYRCHWGRGPRRATRLQRKSKVGTSTPGKGTPHALPNALVKSEAARRSAGQPPEFSESEGAPAWKGGRHPGKSPCKWASGRPQSSGQFPPSGRDMAKAAGRSRGLFAKAPPESRRSARTWLFSGARGKWANERGAWGIGRPAALFAKVAAASPGPKTKGGAWNAPRERQKAAQPIQGSKGASDGNRRLEVARRVRRKGVLNINPTKPPNSGNRQLRPRHAKPRTSAKSRAQLGGKAREPAHRTNVPPKAAGKRGQNKPPPPPEATKRARMTISGRLRPREVGKQRRRAASKANADTTSRRKGGKTKRVLWSRVAPYRSRRPARDAKSRLALGLGKRKARRRASFRIRRAPSNC
ncbi:hypothetical protein TRVL_02993 [Trypanosoma vivax]|nr:hypothetical protein TRVL_02993 [Trypanosoma vivax]